MNKKITFLHMSKGFRNPEFDKKKHSYTSLIVDKIAPHKDIITRPNEKQPFTKSNYFGILSELSELKEVSSVNYGFLMSNTWMNVFCGGRKFGKKNMKEKLNMVYTSDVKYFKDMISSSDLVILRGNYSEWNQILKYVKSKYIFLPCYAKISPKNTKISLDKKRSTIWVDDHEIKNLFDLEGYKCDIFKKPAMPLFYSKLKNVEKSIDVVLVCSHTDRMHKRVDLFIDSLIYIDNNTKHSINATIVGNSSFHKNRIESLNLKNVSLSRAYDGKLTSKKNIIKILDASKIKVCASNIDANPRVISESLSRNVPVLCAYDLGGGKFQINKKTGMFFEPNAKDLAEKIIYALSRLESFDARKNCIKMSDAVSQMAKIII